MSGDKPITPAAKAPGATDADLHAQIAALQAENARLREDEERFRALVSANSDAIYCMSPDWREMRQLHGREFIANTESPSSAWLEKYIHPDDQPRVLAAIADAIRTKTIFELAHRVRRVDGTLGWTFSRAVPVLGAEGEITQWVGAATDITRRKEVEDALHRSQAEADHQRRLYEAILANTPDLAYVFDLDHRFIYANNVLLKMWGRTWDEAIGKTCLELGYEPWHAAMHDREIDQVIATKQPIRGEVPFSGTFGRRIHDYIFVPVLGADGSVEAVAGTTRDVTERKALEQELRTLNDTLEQHIAERAKQLAASAERLYESEHRFRLLVEAVTDYAIFMLDTEGNIVSWNPGAQRIKGYTSEEIIGRHFSTFYTDDDRQSGLPAQVLATAARMGKCELEGWRVRKDGGTFWGSVIVHAIRDPSGQLLGFAKVTRDLTERRTAEEQLRQAQKMEAIGQLTGGVAHDFNNLLGVITGNLDMLHYRLEAQGSGDLLRLVNSASRGAARAAVLTQRLLAFARRQPLEPKPLLVNDLITGMAEMLRRTLGESIAVETVLAAGVWQTLVDANQLESALLNLAVNARDAMPDGGKLTIEAANVYFDEPYAAKAEVPPGQYVGIFVSDTGVGMPPDIMERAFEPFFTTKEPGQGTGLGLSQVYGFMKQSGGHARIYSEVGVGTTIKLYLPRHYSSEGELQASAAAVPIPQATGEVLLVVEDDPDVRATTVEMLRELGYRVIEGTDGASALRLLDAHRDIKLLFTDVGLPGDMNGRQLANQAQRRRPGLKVLFTSGYARNAIVHHGRLDPGVELLMKPFTYAGLAARIRRALDS